MLIMAGHVNAWDYGYSFFLTACESLVHLQKQVAMCVAAGVGIAFGGEQALAAWQDDQETQKELSREEFRDLVSRLNTPVRAFPAKKSKK